MKISLPDADIEYIENFYSINEATALFDIFQQHLLWRQDDIRMFGKIVKIPRLQAWYGDNNLRYRYSNMTLTAQPWTASLLALKSKDNEPELGKTPTIASLSFGAEREFQLKHISTNAKKNILLAPGSLLIMKGNTQSSWQHCLPKKTRKIAPRINLTFRKIII